MKRHINTNMLYSQMEKENFRQLYAEMRAKIIRLRKVKEIKDSALMDFYKKGGMK
jgi:hypothetical protein